MEVNCSTEQPNPINWFKTYGFALVFTNEWVKNSSKTIIEGLRCFNNISMTESFKQHLEDFHLISQINICSFFVSAPSQWETAHVNYSTLLWSWLYDEAIKRV